MGRGQSAGWRGRTAEMGMVSICFAWEMLLLDRWLPSAGVRDSKVHCTAARRGTTNSLNAHDVVAIELSVTGFGDVFRDIPALTSQLPPYVTLISDGNIRRRQLPDGV